MYLADLAISVFEMNEQFYQQKVLSLQQAKNTSLQWVKSIRFQKGDVFIFDENYRIIAHPNSKIEGISIESLKDIKGRNIPKILDNL